MEKHWGPKENLPEYTDVPESFLVEIARITFCAQFWPSSKGYHESRRELPILVFEELLLRYPTPIAMNQLVAKMRVANAVAEETHCADASEWFVHTMVQEALDDIDWMRFWACSSPLLQICIKPMHYSYRHEAGGICLAINAKTNSTNTWHPFLEHCHFTPWQAVDWVARWEAMAGSDWQPPNRTTEEEAVVRKMRQDLLTRHICPC